MWPSHSVWFGSRRIAVSAWVTLPVLWRIGVRFAPHEFMIDRERPAYRYGLTGSLYVPIGDGDWIRTSISGVETQIDRVSMLVEAGRPPK